MIDPIQSPLLNQVPHIQHGFFSRLQDINIQQQDNHLLVCNYFCINRNSLIMPRQNHTKNVHIVHSHHYKNTQDADALITNEKGILLGIQTADCVPILMASASSNQPLIAVIHAGWRGAVKGIIFETVKIMKDLGAKANDIVAAIGPCIWQNSYEVGMEVYDAVETSSFFKPGPRQQHWMFDLPGYVINHLQKCGIHNISPSPFNTFAHPNQYHSYRYNTLNNQETSGRQFSGLIIQ